MKDLKHLTNRVRRIDADPSLPGADADHPGAEVPRHQRGVRDLHRWLATGDLPPEPTPPTGTWLRSRVCAMLDLADLLVDRSAQVIASGIDDPHALNLTALRTLLPPPLPETADPMFGGPEAPTPPQRPTRLPKLWRGLAVRVDRLRSEKPRAVGDMPPAPDATFT